MRRRQRWWGDVEPSVRPTGVGPCGEVNGTPQLDGEKSKR